jgi:hypothetical protein
MTSYLGANRMSSFELGGSISRYSRAGTYLLVLTVSILMLGGTASIALTSGSGRSAPELASKASESFSPLQDIQAQATPTPGYSNGNFAYLAGALSPDNISPMTEAPCYNRVMSEVSFAASTNFGKPPLWVTFSFETVCYHTGGQATWTFGDGNVSTQNQPNGSIVVGGGPGTDYSWWNYTHPYLYVGAFEAQFSLTDGFGDKVVDSRNVYVSLVPSLFYSYYDEAGLIQKEITGSTYSIGLAEECVQNVTNYEYQTDLNLFDAKFALPSSTLSFIRLGNGPCNVNIPGSLAAFEPDLDIEWAHVAAPGAHIYVCIDTTVTVAGLEACDQYFYQNRNRTLDNTMLVSNSWSYCDEGLAVTTSGSPLCVNGWDPYNASLSSYRTAGMNVFSATGDWTPSACGTSNYDSATPYEIAVGGTTVGGVYSSGTYGSEKAWINDSKLWPQCTTGVGRNIQGYYGEMYGNSTTYSAPTWQNQVLGSHYRYYPDVSMDGNQSTGVPIVSGGSWYIVGGTSLGAPVWAGILDVLFQAMAPGLSGFAAPFLYSASAVACFHEILNPTGKSRDGLGTPDIGCLSAA